MTTTPPPKPTKTGVTVFSATSDLHEKINQQRARDNWGRISRYFGMDAFAQEQADAGEPAFRGPYAVVIAVHAPDATTAAALVGSQTTGYSKIGIGLHDGYWVVVLNN